MSREIAVDSIESFRVVITYIGYHGKPLESCYGPYAKKHLAISAGKREVGPYGGRTYRIQRTVLIWEDVPE